MLIEPPPISLFYLDFHELYLFLDDLALQMHCFRQRIYKAKDSETKMEIRRSLDLSIRMYQDIALVICAKMIGLKPTHKVEEGIL